VACSPQEAWQLIDCHLDGGGSIEVVAKLIGVSVAHAKSLARRRKAQRSGEHEPEVVTEYYCTGCRQRVVFRPCQVCAAISRARQTIHEKGVHFVNLPWWAE